MNKEEALRKARSALQVWIESNGGRAFHWPDTGYASALSNSREATASIDDALLRANICPKNGGYGHTYGPKAGNGWPCIYCGEFQLDAALAAPAQEIRKQALEEAAKVCDEIGAKLTGNFSTRDYNDQKICIRCAAAIRSLSEREGE